MTSTNNAHQVLRQFRMIFNAVKTHFQQMEKQAGIGGAQVWALSLIAQQSGMRVGDLARTMDIHQSTASNLIRSLAEQGLVEVRKAAADKRVTCLSATEAGQLLLSRVPGPWAGVLPQALEQLDEASLARLSADLTSLIELLGEDANPRAAQTPLAHL